MAAAAGAAGVITAGVQRPVARRRAARLGRLHFALAGRPLALLRTRSTAPLIALDPRAACATTPARARALRVAGLRHRARRLSDELLARRTGAVALPMRPAVSSLNRRARGADVAAGLP